MSSCAKITAGIALNCDKPLVAGNKDLLTLINMDDVVGITRNVTNPQIIEGITLVSSPAAKAYQFEGKNSSIDTKSDLIKGKYSENYGHQVLFRVFEDGPDVKLQIEKLGKGKFIAIYEKNYRGTADKAAFEIRGLDVGLVATVITQDSTDADTTGAYIITLASQEGFPEPHLPATFFLTDYATTKAAYLALSA